MLVNFLIAGTQKGGTTALAEFLSSHPEVCMSAVKELHFFDVEAKYFGRDGKPNNEYYHHFFRHCEGRPAIGEATPMYMYLPFVPPRIKHYNPAMRLILILRDPTDRAYSQYRMERERKYERLPFSVAIRLEPWRLRDPDLSPGNSSQRVHSYVARGFYAAQIKHLLRFFPREQLLLLRNDELSRQHADTMRRVYNFLGIAEVEPPEPKRVFSHSYPPMRPKDRAYLVRRYKEDVEELERLTGWDLKAWKR